MAQWLIARSAVATLWASCIIGSSHAGAYPVDEVSDDDGDPVPLPSPSASGLATTTPPAFSYFNGTMTQKEQNTLVTIEYRSDGTKSGGFSDVELRQLRKKIIEELNRRRRRTPNRTTTPMSTTTTTTPTPTTTTMTTTTVSTTTATTTVTTTPTSTTASTSTPTTVTTAVRQWFSPNRRRREVPTTPASVNDDEEDDLYSEDDLQFVLVDPLVENGVVRVSFFLAKDDLDIDPDLLLNVTQTLNDTGILEKESDNAVIKIYRGLPEKSPMSTPLSSAALNWPFIVALLVTVIFFIIVVVAFVFIRRTHRTTPADEQPVSPKPQSPSYGQPNGGNFDSQNGPLLPPDDDDDDSGYIVPYIEMMNAWRTPVDAGYSEKTKL
jgi:cell division protein FtsN